MLQVLHDELSLAHSDFQKFLALSAPGIVCHIVGTQLIFNELNWITLSSWTHLPGPKPVHPRKLYGKGLITQQRAREDSWFVTNLMPNAESQKSSFKLQIKHIVMLLFCCNLNSYFPLIAKFLSYPNDAQTFSKLKNIIIRQLRRFLIFIWFLNNYCK